MFPRFARPGRTVATTLLLVTAFTAVRCTMSPNQLGLRLAVDTDALRARLKDTKLANLSCFFVSITGPGVTYDFDALDLQDRSPACMGFGRTSNLATLEDLNGDGIRMRTSAGPSRLIRIFGASTSIKDCTNRPIKDLFDKKVPYIYEVARTEVDLFTDKRVQITQTNDLTQATDIVAPCEGTGGNNLPPGTNLPTAAMLAVSFARTGPPAYAYTKIYDISAGLVPVDTGYGEFPHDVLSNPSFVVQPNARSFYLFAPSGPGGFSYAKRFIVGDGTVTAPSDAISTVGIGATGIYFSGDSKYAYAPGSLVFYQWETHEAGLLTPLSTAGCTASGTVYATSATNFYGFAFNQARMYPFVTGGDLCPGVAAPPPAGLFTGSPVKAVVGSNNILYAVIGNGPSSTLRAYQLSGTGTWTEVYQPEATIDSSAVSHLAIDPKSRFLFVGAQTNGVSVFRLAENGKIIPGSIATVAVGAVSNLTVDPLGRGFYAIEGTSVLRAFSYTDEGVVSPLDVDASLGTDRKTAVVPFPRFN